MRKPDFKHISKIMQDFSLSVNDANVFLELTVGQILPWLCKSSVLASAEWARRAGFGWITPLPEVNVPKK